MERDIVTRADSSEIFQYDYEDYFAYSHFGKMSGYLNMTAAAHWHEDIEFIWVQRGSLLYYVNGDSVPLAQNQGIVVNSRQLHGFRSDDPDCTYLCTLLHPMLLCASREVEQKYVAPLLTGAASYAVLDGGEAWERAVMDALFQIHSWRDRAGGPLKIQSLFYEIWLNLYEHAFRPRTQPQLAKQDHGLTSLKDMVLFIQRNYRRKITLEEIAKAGAVCKSTCLALFKKYLRDTPVNYLIRYRLQSAAKLLRAGDGSVTETAYRCGFSNVSYFIEMFKKLYGRSPLEYRKAGLSGKNAGERA